MEKEAKRRAVDADFVLPLWGNRKRLRCVKSRDESSAAASPSRSDGQRRATSLVGRRGVRRGGGDSKDKDFAVPSLLSSPIAKHRKSESAGSESRRSRSTSLSPEKEDRFYTTRGSVIEDKENGNVNGFGTCGDEKGSMTLPRFFVSLSNKEKEEDFMAMKGCKLPQRPRKRPKLVQKCLLLVSPGAWLTDLTHERYEVREKKNSRKKKRGLKAMCLESDSE